MNIASTGAFFNGVFLLALALSIFLQSIERFVHVEPVNNPLQVLIIGSIGLFLNICSALVVHGTLLPHPSISWSNRTSADHGGHGHGNDAIIMAVADSPTTPLRDNVVSGIYKFYPSGAQQFTYNSMPDIITLSTHPLWYPNTTSILLACLFTFLVMLWTVRPW